MKSTRNLKYLAIALIIISMAIVSCKSVKIPTEPETAVKELKGNDLKNYNYLFSEAIKQKILGNYGQAIVYFKQCLDINPVSDAAMFELSSIYSYARDYPQALKYGRMAAYADEDNLWYQLQLGSLFDVMGKSDSNIIILERIVERYPEKLDFLFQLGSIYSEENLNEKALGVFNKLEESVGMQESISIEKASIYRKTNQTEKAVEEVERLIEAYPDNVEYEILLAELFYELGENERARRKYDELIQNYEENDQVKISLIKYYREIENYDEMIKLVDSILNNEYSGMELKFNLVVSLITDQELLPDIQESLEQSLKAFQQSHAEDIRIFALIGDFYVKTNQYELASQQFRKYIEFDSANYLVWEQLLFILNILDEPDELYEVSNMAMQVFPESAIIYFFNGIACTEIEKNNDAIKVLNKGLDFVRGNTELTVQFYSLLGEAYKNVKQFENSDNAFEEALIIDPGNLIVLNNYSYYLSLRGVKLKKALKMSKVCIEKEPFNSTYLDTYGWVLFNLGKYKHSEKYLRKAIENEVKPSVEILDHCGEVSVKLNNIEKAIYYWERAINAGGDEEEFQSKIRSAKKQ